MYKKSLILCLFIFGSSMTLAVEPWDSLPSAGDTYVKSFGPMAGVHLLSENGFITLGEKTLGMGASGMLESPQPVSVLTFRNFWYTNVKVTISKEIPEGHMKIVMHDEKAVSAFSVSTRRIVPTLPHEKAAFGVKDECFHVVIDAGFFGKPKSERRKTKLFDIEDCHRTSCAKLEEDFATAKFAQGEAPLIEILIGENTPIVKEYIECEGSTFRLPSGEQLKCSVD